MNIFGSSVVYILGLIGAAIYFINGASSFAQIIIGILKSIVWPAIFVYRIFSFLGV